MKPPPEPGQGGFFHKGGSLDRDWWAQEWDRTEYDQSRYELAIARLVQILGGRCVECGATENLEFDHIDPTTKQFSIAGVWNRGDEVLLPELAKCQLLCKEHHQAKTKKMRSVDHGGGLTGKRNCRCELCRIKKNEYARARKNRLKQMNIKSL